MQNPNRNIWYLYLDRKIMYCFFWGLGCNEDLISLSWVRDIMRYNYVYVIQTWTFQGNVRALVGCLLWCVASTSLFDGLPKARVCVRIICVMLAGCQCIKQLLHLSVVKWDKIHNLFFCFLFLSKVTQLVLYLLQK